MKYSAFIRAIKVKSGIVEYENQEVRIVKAQNKEEAVEKIKIYYQLKNNRAERIEYLIKILSVSKFIP